MALSHGRVAPPRTAKSFFMALRHGRVAPLEQPKFAMDTGFGQIHCLTSGVRAKPVNKRLPDTYKIKPKFRGRVRRNLN